MLYKIYWKRSKWIILFASLVIFVSFMLPRIDLIRNWQTSENYYHSTKFVEDYSDDNYTAQQRQAMVTNNLTLHNKDDKMHPINAFAEHISFTLQEINKYSNNTYLLYVLLFLSLGFATFFFDYKTKFNQFLFTNYDRKKIFFSKFLFYSAWICGITLFSTICTEILLAVTIPAKYLNWNLLQIICAILSCVITYYFFFIIGLFLGTTLGHSFFAPFSLLFVVYYFKEFTFLMDYYPNWARYLNTLRFSANFYSIHPYLLVTICLISLGLIFLASYSFTKQSTEISNLVVLLPQFRFVVAGVLILLVTIFYFAEQLITNFYLWWANLPIFISCVLFIFITVYYQSWVKIWHKHQDRHTTRK